MPSRWSTQRARQRSRTSARTVALGVAACCVALGEPSRADDGVAAVASAGSSSVLVTGDLPSDAGVLTSEPSRARLAERPPSSPRPHCGLRRLVCVHAFDGASEAAATRALAIAERSLEALSALRLPAPLDDGARGGSPALDVYLDASAERAAAFADPGLWGARWDRAPAFVSAPPPSTFGCTDELTIGRAVVEASLLGLDAALDPAALEAVASYVALLFAPCSVTELAWVDEAQRAPERSLLESPAAFLYLQHLEERWGSGKLGELSYSLVAVSGQRTPPGNPLVDEPDVLDALRVSLQRNDSSLAASALDFAVARAFLGSRSDDAHLVDVTRYGDSGRPRHEWAVDYDSLPRRLLPARPVAALGASYVWVDLASAPLDAELTFVAEWEAPVVFRFALVRIDAGGAELSRSELVPVFGEARVEKTLRKLGSAGGLLIVALNEGEARRDQPVDPSRAGVEPKSYQLTLYK